MIVDPALLALDYDGTLAPIVDDPAQAVPAPGAVAALMACAVRYDTVAIVTGRPVEQVRRLLGGDVPGLVVLGHYGLEQWDAVGGLVTPRRHPEMDGVRERVAELLTGTEARLEDKDHSVAVHTRATPDPEGLLDSLRPALESIASSAGLVVEPGRLVIELRPPNADKGAALRRLVAERAPASVLYAGDDLGDRTAYDALDQLDCLTVRVFADSAEGPAELRARADVVVDGPPGVVALLEQLSE